MPARLTHLDALRGLAALAVAIFHFMRAFTPGALQPSFLNASPLGALWNGHFAVEVFFALSGYLFFAKFEGAPLATALRAAGKRYVRLTLPALGACVIAWAILVSGGFANGPAAALSGSDWLARWYRFEPSLPRAVGEALAGMYVAFDPLLSYDANLWTIRYELFVVWAVIAAAVAWPRLPRIVQAVAAVALIAVAWQTYALAFVLGAVVAFVRARRPERHWAWLAAAALMLLALSAGAISGWGSREARIAWPASAAVLIAAVDASPRLRRALSGALLRWIGSLSFGLYLMHFITVNAVAAGTYAATGSLAATALAYAVSTILAAWLFRELLDTPSQRLAARLFRERRT